MYRNCHRSNSKHIKNALNTLNTKQYTLNSNPLSSEAAINRKFSSIIRDELLGGIEKKSKKGQKGKKGKMDDGEGSKTDKEYQNMLRALSAPKPKPPAVSAEEMKKRYELGRNYVIGSFKRHNTLHHDLACKIKLKQHAVNLLPKDCMWKDEALKIHDDDEQLQWRVFPTPHVPIPDTFPEHWHRPKEKGDDDDDFYY